MNNCTYSEGGKHSQCEHPHYCIFNENRENLEQKIVESLKKYHELKKAYNSYLNNDVNDVSDYDYHLKKMKLVKNKLIRLMEFKEKIINDGVKGYGYMES